MERQELIDYCTLYADSIYVRAQIDGRWKSVPLSQVSQDTRESYIELWLRSGMLPGRIL